MKTLYGLNIEKVKQGCQDMWLGSTSLDDGSSPKDIVIDEGEPLHFVQLLFLLKEKSWEGGKWIAFTEEDMTGWVNEDANVYLENDAFFGVQFVNEFPNQIRLFLAAYCDNVGRY